MVRKNCRNKKIENTLTHHGTDTAVNVSNQPPRGLQIRSAGSGHGRFVNSTKFGISVTSCGIIMVPRKTMNSASRPGKRSRANAYAARTDVASVPNTVAKDRTPLFKKNRAKLAARQASA